MHDYPEGAKQWKFLNGYARTRVALPNLAKFALGMAIIVGVPPTLASAPAPGRPWACCSAES